MKLRCLAIGALAAGCGVNLGPPQPWQPIDQPGPDGLVMPAERSAPDTFRAARFVQSDPLRVVSYNTEYGQDPAGLAAAILGDPELSRAGLILLQEEESYPGEIESRTAVLARLLGLGYVYVPARIRGDGTHGLAILSAFPVDQLAKMDLPRSDGGRERIALAADVHVGDRTLHVIDVHLETRLNARDRVAHLHPAVVDAPDQVLIAGDFNTSWVTWVDGVPLLGSEHDQVPILDSYMASQGFDAPSSDSGPTEHAFGLEFKLDSFYTRGLEATFGGVVRTGPSDHWPLWLDVRLP